jgi:phosphate transport system substrate-binding protein
MKNKFTRVVSASLGVLAGCLIGPAPLGAQTVRVHGATTLSKILTEQQPALEAQTGLKLEIVGNGSGRGLTDLIAGQADIAMLAGSVTGIADALNKEKPASVDASGLQGTPLPSVKLLFVINPSAGVKSFTEAQARDVFTGKVANWKEVGGADLSVKVVLPAVGDGARVTTQEQVLGGADFVKDAIVRNSSKDIPPVIGQLPGSVSFLSEKNAAGLTTVAYEKDLQMPSLLVTRGEPAGDVKKVVDAVKGIIK